MRRRFQFSLRTAIVMSVLAGLLIWAGMKYYRWSTYCTATVSNQSGRVVKFTYWIQEVGFVFTAHTLDLQNGQAISIEVKRRPVRRIEISYSSVPSSEDENRKRLTLLANGAECSATIQPDTKCLVDPPEYQTTTTTDY